MFISKQISSKLSDSFNENDLLKFPLFRKDKEFIEFFKEFAGSTFFENSLYIFSLGKIEEDCLNIEDVNIKIKMLYRDFNVSDCEFFSQDIFGNLMYFDDEGIGFFEIETGVKSILSSDFTELNNVIEKDFEFLTGINYLKDWQVVNNLTLKITDRLCPKIPFVLGGDYVSKNLYPKNSYLNWEFNSDLALQIKETPDGTPFQINVITPQ